MGRRQGLKETDLDHSSHSFFDQTNFMPHGHCYLWKPALVWTHVVSDLLIGLAYISISITLYLLVRRIRLPFSPVFIAFGLFIGACGLTHFMEIWNLWNADYWAGGMVKVVTAIASVATGIALVPIKPKVVALADAARLSEERKVKLESAHAELGVLYDKVKEADVLKTQFFANVSHELRTPISLILGPIEQLLAKANLAPEDRKHLDIISRNSKTLLKQVNDLLDVSKLEAGRLKPQYVKSDLVKLFKFVAAHFETVMQSRSIFFTLHAPDSITAEIDPEKVQRIYMNLLSNAIKFVPDGGRIRASIQVDGAEGVFTIEDTGPGVPDQVKEQIFERFRQGEEGTNRKYGGTGLGLAIVKDFTELHGGSVKLIKGLAPGATFSVRLPLRAPGGALVTELPEIRENVQEHVIEGTVEELRVFSTKTDDAVFTNSARATVLVCEDNPDMNRFVTETLATEFNVLRAMDGREGLAKARASHPDLVVSDIMMPNMSGDQLVKEIRGDAAIRDIPILLLSARADDDLRVKLLEQGEKPCCNQGNSGRIADGTRGKI
jgi:signal transduction histidine kinase/CheY-like chemotaxis protein